MELWEEAVGIGKLYIEEELVVGTEPVLQLCVDSERYNRYLVMTYDSGAGEYVVCRVSRRALIDMLENRRTMEETFRAAGKIYMTRQRADGLLEALAYDAAEFPADKLPDAGAYYDISSEYIRRYVERLKGNHDMLNNIEIELIETEVFKRIGEIRMSLAVPVCKADVRYDMAYGPAVQKEYTADYVNACNNRYSVNHAPYTAA